MAKHRKILITGGAGYLGGALTDQLIEKGHEVTVYDNLTYEGRYMKNLPFVLGDVRDREMLKKLLPKFDTVIWLAALVGDGACSINPDLTTAINLDSIKWLTQNYQGKIAFMSTASVYGINGRILDESAGLNPLSHYAITKLEAEKSIQANTKDHLIFRLATLFGLGDNYSRPRFDLVVNTLTKQAVLNKTLNVFGGGQWRPLLHVKDAANAIVFALDNEITGLYNLHYDNMRICDIAEEIKKKVIDAKIIFSNIKFEDLRNYRMQSDKYRAFGWSPKHTLQDGIREIIKLLTEKRLKYINDSLYSNAEYLKQRIL